MIYKATYQNASGESRFLSLEADNINEAARFAKKHVKTGEKLTGIQLCQQSIFAPILTAFFNF